MFKAMIFLKRRNDMSLTEFVDWWTREHAPLAARLTGVRGVHFNVIHSNGNGDFDGISELWFDDQAAFEAAYAEPHGKAVAADSMAHVSRRERVFVDEHRIVPARFAA